MDFAGRGAAETLAILESSRRLEGIFCPFLPLNFFKNARPERCVQ
jgi:hypothetical protein